MDWTAPAAWDPAFWTRTPMLELLAPTARPLDTPEWPTLADYNRLLEQAKQPILTRSGLPVHFVPQAAKPQVFEEEYEPRIYLKGEVQTRTENWHDLFNALVWIAFPETKAELNAQHFLAAGGKTEAGNRGASRDVLTLFDESGVAIACADPALATMLQERRWKDLFWHHREEVIRGMRFFLFGHSLHEKALLPYLGLTGKGAFFPVEAGFFTLSLTDQLATLDRLMSTHFANPDTLRSTAALYPVPLLGVPGWWPDQSESFYDDTHHFRPPRSAKAPQSPSVTRANRA